MNAFLYLNLAPSSKLLSYHQPVLELVRTIMPGVAMLDLDADSDEMMMGYAKRMLQEASQVIVCIKAEEDASFRVLMTLLEEMLQENRQQLVLLLGQNQRIRQILEARPQIGFKQVSSDIDLLEEMSAFYS